MEKTIRDGKVAVIYSPGFGAGWSTWAMTESGEPDTRLIFDPTLVALIENKASEAEISARAKEISPDFYTGGARDVRVTWLPVGTLFRITEYDGSEGIEVLTATAWIKA